MLYLLNNHNEVPRIIYELTKKCLEAESKEVPLRIKYSGRPTMASTATGYGEVHAHEQASLINNALDMGF